MSVSWVGRERAGAREAAAPTDAIPIAQRERLRTEALNADWTANCQWESRSSFVVRSSHVWR